MEKNPYESPKVQPMQVLSGPFFIPGPVAPRRRAQWQFSLHSLFVAAMFDALAFGAALTLILSNDDDEVFLFSFIAVPLLLCGVVAALRGRVVNLLGFGVLVDFFLYGLGILK